ncbi:S10 family peptidase [Flavimarina sp. Hel_I_48]|uniref:S10 family peptidase n=1 Tax=Flavimarina sp. Hel_I_48 TaxID=1392488 RepID=UPI0004DF47B7|nr:carboxypeptidase [Flavimarina sp. Hel_I_48]
MIKNYTFLSFLFLLLTGTQWLSAQQVKVPIDTIITTQHTATIKGSKVPYTANTSFQPVWDEKGNPIASLYYTYYKRTDIKDDQARPLVISFNGGPGSASVWMHIAYTGPRILKIDDEGFPVQPYGIKDNPNSILDVADIVYVNPVNTGYSRMVPDKEGKMPDREHFFGVNSDISYLADWVSTFVTRVNRWRSPKFLIGESYGTTRVAGLSLALQQNKWMYLNGVIMVSPTEIGFEFEGPVEIANRLPYFAAAAWYHKALPTELQQKDLDVLLPEVETYAVNELLPAVAKGGYLPAAERDAVIKKMAYYSGLSEKTIRQNNLAVPFDYFWKDLLREKEGYTIGRLDSRYKGMDVSLSGSEPDYNSELTSWLHSFTPAINYYISQELDFKTDLDYDLFGNVHPWDRSDNHAGADLREAMTMNPNLNVMIQSGYFDGATTYFNAKYLLGQLNINGKLDDRLSFKGYRSGHMMYLRAEDLKTANQDLRDFIENASKNIANGAKY